jgi:predicted TIM-barrel fold metal-dependent hydrolase
MIFRRISAFLFMTCVFDASFAQPSKESIELAKSIPIADVHMHTFQHGARSAAWWLEKMDANNVKWGGAVGDYREDVRAVLGDRYIPAIGQLEFSQVFFSDGATGLTNLNNPIFQELFIRAERLLQSREVRGFGELHINNNTSGPPRFRRAVRLDNPVMRKFYEIAEKYQGFIQIHAEFDRDFERDILNFSADYPNVTTVLSHCLSTSDANVLASLFGKRKNITCEMSSTGEALYRLIGSNKSPLTFNSSGPFSGWKKLIEAHSEQIMLGTDPCCGADRGYSELVSELRENLLPYFSTEIMEKLAYKNALRIFKLKE